MQESWNVTQSLFIFCRISYKQVTQMSYFARKCLAVMYYILIAIFFSLKLWMRRAFARSYWLRECFPHDWTMMSKSNGLWAIIMPSSHLAIAMGLRSPYPARIPLSVRPPRGLPAEAGGGCEIFVRIHRLRGLYDLASRDYLQIWKNRKLVARRHVVGGIAQSPHGHRAKADPRTGSVRFPCVDAEIARQLHWHCTISVQSPHSLCTDLPRVAPEAP